MPPRRANWPRLRPYAHSLVHFSTDYVFDGRKQGAYREDDAPNPLGVYGATKLAGEQAVQRAGAPHLILRTSWVYGRRGRNFLLTMQRLARERDTLAVVERPVRRADLVAPDCRGNRFGGRALADPARPSCQLGRLSSELRRTHQLARLHCGDTGASGQDGRKTDQPHGDSQRQLSTPAARPANSELDCDKLAASFGVRLPDWETRWPCVWNRTCLFCEMIFSRAHDMTPIHPVILSGGSGTRLCPCPARPCPSSCCRW